VQQGQDTNPRRVKVRPRKNATAHGPRHAHPAQQSIASSKSAHTPGLTVIGPHLDCLQQCNWATTVTHNNTGVLAFRLSKHVNKVLQCFVVVACWQVASQLLPWRVRIQSGGQMVHQGEKEQRFAVTSKRRNTPVHNGVSAAQISM
jgi:hypothetical protein